MDFQFYQVEEEKHYNVCNNTFTFEERVFKSIRLNKDNYKLRKPQQVFDDISYFLNMRVEYCKNNYKGYCENNFSVNFDFFPFTGELENPIDLDLFDATFSMFRDIDFPSDEELFNKKLLSYMEDNFCYEIKVKETLVYLTQFVSNSDTDGKEEDVTMVQNHKFLNKKESIIKIFKEDKCIICLENKPNMLYENCKHIPTCSSCEEIKNLNNCPICRSIVTLKVMMSTN